MWKMYSCRWLSECAFLCPRAPNVHPAAASKASWTKLTMTSYPGLKRFADSLMKIARNTVRPTSHPSRRMTTFVIVWPPPQVRQKTPSPSPPISLSHTHTGVKCVTHPDLIKFSGIFVFIITFHNHTIVFQPYWYATLRHYIDWQPLPWVGFRSITYWQWVHWLQTNNHNDLADQITSPDLQQQ